MGSNQSFATAFPGHEAGKKRNKQLSDVIIGTGLAFDPEPYQSHITPQVSNSILVVADMKAIGDDIRESYGRINARPKRRQKRAQRQRPARVVA